MGLRLVTSGFDAVSAMDAPDFRGAVTAAFDAVFSQLDDAAARHPVRFWAFIPGIHDDLGGGLDRYMVFNAGRFSAFHSRHQLRWEPDGSLPTASGVGADGDRLMLACVAGLEPGTPVENPRQIPAYRYSNRFGPRPPFFARATIVRSPVLPLLLVGGTAAITGEESRHPDDLDGQLHETLRNLAAVTESARGASFEESTSITEIAAMLSRFRELRVYYTRTADRERVASRIAEAFPTDCRIELRRAELCRRELLVEIEGLAMLEPGTGR